MYTPRVAAAMLRRRYRLGSYEARLFSDIQSIGPIQYLYMLVVLQSGSRESALFVASETSEMPAALGPMPPFLGVFSAEGHDNMGASDEWADIERFTNKALSIAAGSLGVAGEPELLDTDG